jgi:predicted AlkP superfamily pyrophosphatase or phosphodiesterase
MSLAPLTAVYYEDPDYTGHKFDLLSAEVGETLESIDDEIGKLIDTQNQVNQLCFLNDKQPHYCNT